MEKDASKALKADLMKAHRQAERLRGVVALGFYLVGAAVLWWAYNNDCWDRHGDLLFLLKLAVFAYGIGGIPLAGWLADRIQYSRSAR